MTTFFENAKFTAGMRCLIQLINIYYDKKKDKENTLKAVRMAMKKFPTNTEYPKYELNIYLADKKYDMAKNFVQEIIKRDHN